MSPGPDPDGHQVRRHGYVAITGTIGAGKSSLARLLEHHLGWRVFLEGDIHRDNQFFAGAYTDFGRWGFHSQVDFLTASAERHAMLAAMLADRRSSDTEVIVEDRTPFEHTEGYLRAYAALGRIAPREVALLTRLTAVLEPHYVVPDLLVFRRLDSNELQDRIRLRSRPDEDKADLELLNAINYAFEEMLREWTRSPVLVLDPAADVFDTSQTKKTIDDVVNALAVVLR